MDKPTFHFFNNFSYIDLYPIQFGYEKCNPLHAFGPTKRQNYLFHYIISGKGTFFDTVTQTAYKLSAGEGFLIPPHHTCSYEASQTDSWFYAWIECDGLKAKTLFEDAGLGNKNLIYRTNIPSEESIVKKELMTIIENYQENDTYLMGHLYLLLDAIIKESSSPKKKDKEETQLFYIREAISYIKNNLDLDITIDDIARHCNLNRSYFSRFFKKHMTISPKQFLIQYRMKEALNLLRNPDNNLQDIAEKLGYSNQFNFSAAFKKTYHISPNEWRQKYQKKIDFLQNQKSDTL